MRYLRRAYINKVLLVFCLFVNSAALDGIKRAVKRIIFVLRLYVFGIKTIYQDKSSAVNSIVSFFKYADSRFKSIFVIELYAQYTLLKLTVVYDADILDVDAVEG